MADGTVLFCTFAGRFQVYCLIMAEEKQNIKEQFNDIVNDGIAPILKAAGFKKRGNNFHVHVGEMDWGINTQKDRWGYDDYFNTWKFTINIDVTWSDYAFCLFNEVCDFPLGSSCPIRIRIGNFIGKGDCFTLRPNQDYSSTKDLICSTIKSKVLPLLNNIKYLNDLWDLIEDNYSWYQKLFHIGVEQKIFWTTSIGLYLLCLATGKIKQ